MHVVINNQNTYSKFSLIYLKSSLLDIFKIFVSDFSLIRNILYTDNIFGENL